MTKTIPRKPIKTEIVNGKRDYSQSKVSTLNLVAKYLVKN